MIFSNWIRLGSTVNILLSIDTFDEWAPILHEWAHENLSLHFHFYQNHYLIKKIFPTIINALRYDHKWWDLFISSPFRYCQYFEISNRLRANEELYGTIYWTVWNNELWDIKKSKLPSYQTINPMGQFVPSLIFITTWLYILSGPSLIMLSPNV